MKQNTDTIEETTTESGNSNSSQSSDGVEVIADGALCTCTGASCPAPQQLTVISQQKVYCNGGSLLVATTNDNNIANVNFGSCSLKNNAPCTCTIQWQNPYKDIDILGASIITMDSVGLCQGQQIEFKTCGQVESVSSPTEATIAQAEVMVAQNQLIDVHDIVTPKENIFQKINGFIENGKNALKKNINKTSETNLIKSNQQLDLSKLLENLNTELPGNREAVIDHSILKERFEENTRLMERIQAELDSVGIKLDESNSETRGKVKSIKPVTYKLERKSGVLFQPVNKFCDFEVDTTGTLSWIVRDEDMKTIFEQDGGTKIKLRFPDKKNSDGKFPKYVIEAFGGSTTTDGTTSREDLENSSDTYFNTLVIQPTENEILLEANKKECSINGEVSISLKKLFADVEVDMSISKYEVRKANVPISSELIEITQTSDGATILFKQEGEYVVTAESAARKPVKIHATNSIKVKPLLVEQVKVNGQTGEYSTRKGTNLEFSAKLSVEDADQSNVKWQVIFSDGSETKTYPEGHEKPKMDVFNKAGTYKVYAFMIGKSDNVKVVVNMIEPIFEKIEWKDANGNILKEIGKREKLYAHITLKAATGLDFKLDLCKDSTIYRSFDKGNYRVNSEAGGSKTLVIEIEISNFSQSVISTLKDQDKFHFKIQAEDRGLTVVNTNKTIDYPIIYTTKEKITSLKFYSDESCTQEIVTATYGDTIYAKALSRNLTGSKIKLYIVRDKNWATDKSLYSKENEVQEDGSAIFEITINKDWKIENESDFYVAKLTEAGDSVGSKAQLAFDKTSDTKSGEEHSANIRAMLGKIVDAEGKVITRVGQVEIKSKVITKTDCEKCKKFTENDFKMLFPKVVEGKLFQKGENNLKNTTIKALADELNKAFDEFGIDNCNRKLHFLTQIACETGGFIRVDENLNYSGTNFRNANWPESGHPDLYKSNAQTKFSNKPEALANYVYRDNGGNGDEASKDGYKYRGRGLIQLTFKNNYKLFEDYLVSKEEITANTLVDDPGLLLSNLNYLVRSAAWFWKYGKGSSANKQDDRLDMSKLADKGDITKITLWLHGSTSTLDKRIGKYDELRKYFDLGLCNFYINHLAKDYVIDYHIRPTLIEKHVPKDKTVDEIFQYRYFYHDETGTEHYLCNVISYKAQKWIKGTSQLQSGADWVKVTVDGVTRYYQKDGDNKCILVKVPSSLSVSGIFAYFDNTTRECANSDSFAVMLAAMADTGYTDYYFNGYAQYSGTGAPSVGHVNGINLDIRYLKTKQPELPIYINTSSTANGWETLDLDRHNTFMKKAYERGFKQFYIMPSKTKFTGQTKSGWDTMCETLATILEKTVNEVKGIGGNTAIYKYGSPHEHHVHLQELASDSITIIEKI